MRRSISLYAGGQGHLELSSDRLGHVNSVGRTSGKGVRRAREGLLGSPLT